MLNTVNMYIHIASACRWPLFNLQSLATAFQRDKCSLNQPVILRFSIFYRLPTEHELIALQFLPVKYVTGDFHWQIASLIRSIRLLATAPTALFLAAVSDQFINTHGNGSICSEGSKGQWWAQSWTGPVLSSVLHICASACLGAPLYCSARWHLWAFTFQAWRLMVTFWQASILSGGNCANKWGRRSTQVWA